SVPDPHREEAPGQDLQRGGGGARQKAAAQAERQGQSQPEGAGGTLPVAGDCHPSDSAGAEALHGAAAPALPVAAVDLRPAGLLAEKNNSLHYFFRNIAGQAEGLEGRCQSLVT
ncbi:unnamed protein product, partial [Ascophyllum nodosum]